MHVLLGEGDPDAGLVERELASASRGLPNVPVVLRLAPDADLPIDRGAPECLQDDLRGRVLDHPGDVRGGLLENGTGCVDACRVLRTDVDVDATGVIPRVVGDRAAEDRAVRDDQLLVVERFGTRT